MARFKDIQTALKVRDRMFGQKLTRLQDWRDVVDRTLGDVLAKLKEAIAPDYQQTFIPYQTAEPGDELRRLVHILVANEIELEVVLREEGAELAKRAQELEHADEAVLDRIFTMRNKILLRLGQLGDGYAPFALDRLEPGEQLAAYADRADLDAYVERGKHSDKDPKRREARERYRDAYGRALAKSGNARRARNEAYTEVTEKARERDGFPWMGRVLDPFTFRYKTDKFSDTMGVSIGVEYGQVELSPLIAELEGHGVKLVGSRFTRTEDGKDTHQPPVGTIVRPVDQGGSTSDAEGKFVGYTQIRTRECWTIILEHPDADNPDEPGIMLQFDNPFGGKHSGYDILEGDMQLRPRQQDQHLPPILGLLVEAQQVNVAESALSAMLLEEATRPPYIKTDKPSPTPAMDSTKKPKAAKAKDGVVQQTAGEWRRVETTGAKVEALASRADEHMERYRTKEFFSGTGSAGEAALHLARLQTAFLTKLVPYQNLFAELCRNTLDAIHCAVVYDGTALYVPWAHKDPRKLGDGIRVAKPRMITPEMAQLPVELVVKIGTETDETKYAREAASRAEVAAGHRSILTHLEITGVKDPKAEIGRLMEGKLIFGAIGDGQTEGWAVTMLREMMQARMEAWLASRFPLPPQPPAPPTILGPDGAPLPPASEITTGMGSVPPGQARFNPPVQTVPNSGGVPAVVGAPQAVT